MVLNFNAIYQLLLKLIKNLDNIAKELNFYCLPYQIIFLLSNQTKKKLKCSLVDSKEYKK